MALDETFPPWHFLAMTTLTPQQVRERAITAKVRLIDVIERAGISKVTFYRWEKGANVMRPLTLRKLESALEQIEACSSGVCPTCGRSS